MLEMIYKFEYQKIEIIIIKIYDNLEKGYVSE